MGTRLYPITKNPQTLELLAKVPSGTFDLLQKNEAEEKAEIEKACKGKNPTESFQIQDEIESKFYNLRFKTPLSQLDIFQSIGWGKLHSPVYGLLEKAGKNPVWGEELDPSIVQKILNLQGVELPPEVSVENLEGICWS